MIATTQTPPPGATADPLGYLSKCHHQIVQSVEEILNLLDWTQGGTLDKMQEREMIVSLERLNRSVRLHGMDEADSLQPRLESCENADVRSIAPVLATLIEETRSAEAVHADVDVLVRKWLREKSLVFLEVWSLHDKLTELHDAFTRHAKLEQEGVFAIAETGLCENCKHSITAEMLWRRGLA